MEFTYTEKNGEKPIEEWLAAKIKEHAKKKFGVELNIEIHRKSGNTEDQKKASL